MAKVLQKPAESVHELHPPHKGILHPDEFYAHFQLRNFEPSPELAPFVAYVWTQRWEVKRSISYESSAEIFTGPHSHFFFTKDKAFIHGVHTKGFDYSVSGKTGVIAGVKFKPGGIYPFLQQPATTIKEKKIALETLFPEITPLFLENLLAQDDQGIVAGITALVARHLPEQDKNIAIIEEILQAMADDRTLTTVKAVASRFKRSERNVQEIFQTYVGVGVKWVLMRNRLLRAAEYARSEPDPDWLEIAHELGYSNQPHFASDFKRVVGQTLTQYVRDIR